MYDGIHIMWHNNYIYEIEHVLRRGYHFYHVKSVNLRMHMRIVWVCKKTGTIL